MVSLRPGGGLFSHLINYTNSCKIFAEH